MHADVKEMLNPHLRKSYRVLLPTFEILISERFPNLTDVELAKKLNVEIKTLRSIRDGNMIYGETIRKVAESLGVAVYGFAENESDRDILRALLDLAIDRTKGLSRWPLRHLLEIGSHWLKRLNGMWHWSDRVHDDARLYRRLFAEDKSQQNFGVFEVEFEGTVFDAVLSYELLLGPLARGRSHAVFGLFIDYGRLFKRRDELDVWSLETSIHRSVHKRSSVIAANKVLFITWIDPAFGPLLIRSQTPFTIRLRGMLDGDEGDRRLLDGSDPLVGYQRWAFHQSLPEPWQRNRDEAAQPR